MLISSLLTTSMCKVINDKNDNNIIIILQYLEILVTLTVAMNDVGQSALVQHYRSIIKNAIMIMRFLRELKKNRVLNIYGRDLKRRIWRYIRLSNIVNLF